MRRNAIPSHQVGCRGIPRRFPGALITPVLALLSIQAPLRAEVARRADSFVDSIGVNTHFGVPYSVYSLNPGSVHVQRLVESGIRYVRNNRTDVKALHDAAQIKTLVVMDSKLAMAEIMDMLAKPHVIGIEGFNEPDSGENPKNWDGIYDDPDTGNFSGTRAFQQQLYAAAKASDFKNKPILAPAMGWWRRAGLLPPLPFDKLSLHSYTNAYYPGHPWLDSQCIPYTAQMIAAGQSPQGIWVTEVGYHNAINDPRLAHIPVTEAVSAKYIPRLFTLYFNRRIEKTFVYELLDIGTDLAYNEHNFGLLRRDGSRKPAFWAVKNLIHLLKDTGGQSFTPGALNITLTGDTDSVNRTLLQKANGDYYLLLWNEVRYNDPAPSAQVTVGLGNVASSITVYTALAAQNYGTQTHANVSSLELTVPDEVIVLKISGITGTGTGVPPPPSGVDLVITKAWTIPAEPLVGEPAKLFASVENRGTAGASHSSQIKMSLNGHPSEHPLTFHVPALAAGASITLESMSGSPPAPATWRPATAGGHHFSLSCDTSNTVAEVNENNNNYLLTVPVPSDRWTDPCDSLANWTASGGGWAINSGGGRTFFANTSQYSSGTLTHTLPQPLTTNWHLDFDYSWHHGDGSHDLSVMVDALTSSGNGYRIRVRQGVASGPGGSLGKLIQLFKITNGVVAATPFAEGPGYNLPGDPTSTAFRPVRLVFDRSAQSLSVYIDLNGDGVWEQSIAPARDTSAPVRDFDKIVLSAQDEQGAWSRPKFDNIQLTRGLIDLAPAPYFTDSFADLSQWTNVVNWDRLSGGYIRNTSQHATGTLTHVFPTTLHNGWTLRFDYDFLWGGAASTQSLKFGHHNLLVYAELLNTYGNGYRVTVRQGDSNSTALHAKVVQILRVQDGVSTLLAEGVGYNTPGWMSLGRARPDFKPIIFTYDRATQRLSVLADLNRDGVMEEVIAPVHDATFSAFNKLVLGARDGQGGTPGVGPCLDNITVGTLGFSHLPAPTAYELWTSGHGISGASAAEDADPDGDGQPNLLEFALGSRPDRAESVNVPVVRMSRIDGRDHLALTVPKGPYDDAENSLLTVEVSSDLIEWFSAAPHVVVLEDSSAMLDVRDATPVSASSRRFIRLRAGLPAAP